MVVDQGLQGRGVARVGGGRKCAVLTGSRRVRIIWQSPSPSIHSTHCRICGPRVLGTIDWHPVLQLTQDRSEKGRKVWEALPLRAVVGWHATATA